MSKHSASGAAWQAQRLRVLNRDGWQCSLCGVDLDPINSNAPTGATVDHVEPIAHADSRTYRDDELVSACRKCNSTKQDRALVRLDWHNPRWF